MIGINTRMNYAKVHLSEDLQSNEISADLLTLDRATKVGDTFKKGSLDRWFDKQNHKTIPMLYGHKTDSLPIGEWELNLTGATLQAKGTLYNQDIQEAQETLWCLNNGIVNGVSTVFEIYNPVEDDTSIIKEAGVFEASIVLFPWSGLTHWCEAEHERWYDATLDEVLYEWNGSFRRLTQKS